MGFHGYVMDFDSLKCLELLCRELEKIQVEGDALYLPTDPTKLVKGIELDSGIPLQSAAKVPIMITFDVVDKEGDHNQLMRQACIFKVGRVLLLQKLVIDCWSRGFVLLNALEVDYPSDTQMWMIWECAGWR